MSIKVSNLLKSYTDIKAVDTISFSIEKGEIVGFLGPNGAGKSTVMKILTGFIKNFEGEVFINGKSVKTAGLKTQNNIGYLPEHNPLYTEMYVKEYLAFNASIYKIGKEKIENIIDEVGLTSHADKKINELSKGYRQRVGLAAALLHDPDVLILDEPTTGLDPNQLVEIRNLIKKVGKDKTVLFSTHIMQEVEAVCSRVIIINKGKIVTDQAIDSLQSSQKQVINVEFDKIVKETLFDTISNLIKVENIQDSTWQLHFDSKEDQRATVFDFAHEKGLKILDMSRNSKGLEELFHELTK